MFHVISDLHTRIENACFIRETLDTVRDSEFARALPNIIRPIVELLRAGEPAFLKDSQEYLFRRTVFEIINRLPVHEAIRVHLGPLFACMMHIIRNDNEENGATACKTMVDLLRNYRSITEESAAEFLNIFRDSFQNMQGMLDQYLSADSPPVDPNVSLHAIRSFKVLGEMGMVMVMMSQIQRNLISSTLQGSTAYAFEVLALEAPAQLQARTDFEAMGGIWAGVAPTIKNTNLYNEFTQAQIKARSLLVL